MIGNDFIHDGYMNHSYIEKKLSLEILEECAFIESGLVAHGCLEKLDDYTKDAIVKYGRYLLKYQNKLSDEHEV